MMHTMQALEKTSRAPRALSAFILSTSTDRSVFTEKTSRRREKGKKTLHHSAHQTPGSAFFKPSPPHQILPRPPARIHPPLATQGHASGLCMTACNVPCHKCFPNASTSAPLSADGASPQPRWGGTAPMGGHIALCFSNVSTISGRLARRGGVASSAVWCTFLHVGFCTFEYIHVFFSA